MGICQACPKQLATCKTSKQYSKQPEWLKLPVGCLWLSPSLPRSCQSASVDTASCSGHVVLCRMHSSLAHTPAAAHDPAKAAMQQHLQHTSHLHCFVATKGSSGCGCRAMAMVLSSCACAPALGRGVHQGDMQIAGEVSFRRLGWPGIRNTTGHMCRICLMTGLRKHSFCLANCWSEHPAHSLYGIVCNRLWLS